MKKGDIVKCPRLGDGEFVVTGVRVGSNPEVQLRPRDDNWGEKTWMYEAHCIIVRKSK